MEQALRTPHRSLSRVPSRGPPAEAESLMLHGDRPRFTQRVRPNRHHAPYVLLFHLTQPRSRIEFRRYVRSTQISLVPPLSTNSFHFFI